MMKTKRQELIKEKKQNNRINALETVLGTDTTTTATYDTINENTAGGGVTVDGVLLKDGIVQAINGTVSTPSIRGAATNSGIYFSSGAAYFSTAGSHYAGLGGAGQFIIAASATTGGLTTSIANTQGQFIHTAAPQTITAGTGGAISVACYYTNIAVDAGGDAYTLANGVMIGQMKKITLTATAGGTGVITGAFRSTNNTLTFTNAGEFAILMWDGTDWLEIELGSVATLTHAPILLVV